MNTYISQVNTMKGELKRDKVIVQSIWGFWLNKWLAGTDNMT